MPRSGQIILKNSFPTEEVFVNNNTIITDKITNVSTGGTSFLFVVSSPKGKDNQMQTISSQKEFLDKIGLGPFSIYGQPLTTAYSVVSTGKATLQLLRVSAPNAKYACAYLCAAYKVDENGKMIVRFSVKTPENGLKDLDNLESAYVPSEEPDENGFTEVVLFAIASQGKGTYGNAYQFSLDKMASTDRENDFKNYTFKVYEVGSSDVKEAFHVCFYEDALIGSVSYFADSVIMSPTDGSEYIKFVSFPESFQQITDAYANVIKTWNESNPDTQYTEFTIKDIDILLGSDKYNKQKAMPLYEIDTVSEGTINLQGSDDGLPAFNLVGGDDGDLSPSADAKTRAALLEELYLKAYSGEIDPLIRSKNRFPTTILPDCNSSKSVKAAIHTLHIQRTDCVTLFDAGITLPSQNVVIPMVNDLCGNFNDTYESVDAYAGKIRDPYNQKIITVTSTYALCLLYANQFYACGAKHTPLADNSWGNLEDVFIKGTIYPIFDEDIHEDIMNDLIEEHINFARVNALNEVHRATQDTRDLAKSVLSELSNAFLLKDIKRAMERLCARNRYEFSESSDIERFNGDASRVCEAFKGQVRSISAAYGQSSYESLYNILHLYVETVVKNINKSTIIEIDVNRE